MPTKITECNQSYRNGSHMKSLSSSSYSNGLGLRSCGKSISEKELRITFKFDTKSVLRSKGLPSLYLLRQRLGHDSASRHDSARRLRDQFVIDHAFDKCRSTELEPAPACPAPLLLAY